MVDIYHFFAQILYYSFIAIILRYIQRHNYGMIRNNILFLTPLFSLLMNVPLV